MLTDPFPPNTVFSASSAWIIRRFFLSCRLFRLMYAQSFFVTSVRGSGLSPTTSLRAGLGVIGFMNAALGCRPELFLLMRSPLEDAHGVEHGAYHESPGRHTGRPLRQVLKPASAILLARRGGLARREDLFEGDKEPIHLVGRADRHAQVLEHRRKRTADHHAALAELLDDR